MSAPKPLFLLDLDSTITKEELLPYIARTLGCCPQMQQLTEQAMQGASDPHHSFAARVALLGDIPVSRVRALAAGVPVHPKLAAFIRRHRHRCRIATGNLDVWIEDLIERLDMTGRCYCSQAEVAGDRLVGIRQLLDKRQVVCSLPAPVVAIGDGDNDAGMIAAAAVGIGFGGARPIAPSVLGCARYTAYSEDALCALLEEFV